MLTDRDIAIRVVAEGRDPKSTKVRDAMTSEVVACFDDQEVEEAAILMREQQIRRIPVLSKKRKLVGVVSLGDIAIETSGSQLGGDALKGVSQPGGCTVSESSDGAALHTSRRTCLRAGVRAGPRSRRGACLVLVDGEPQTANRF
jgi:hypothetical protein